MNAQTEYLLQLADNALLLGQRHAEWCGHAPILEQDIAISNLALDCIGQARNLYQYAALQIGNACTEDALAYLRDAHEFRNCLLMELPNGDWAQTILRIFLSSSFQYFQYSQLQNCSDPQLAAIAEKSLKEVTYHLRWSSEWVIRLGDGTQESRTRILAALDYLWPYTGELFMETAYEISVDKENKGIHPEKLKPNWEEKVSSIFAQAGLPLPANEWMHKGGKVGIHTEHLGFVLAEMQFLQRAYPGANW